MKQKRQIILGKPIKTLSIRRGSIGLASNPLGNTIYTKTNSNIKLKNKSIRPFMVTLESNKNYYALKFQGCKKRNRFNQDLVYFINAGHFINLSNLQFPTKPSFLILNQIYKIPKSSIKDVVDFKDKDFKKEDKIMRTLTWLEQYDICVKIENMINNYPDEVSINALIENKYIRKQRNRHYNKKVYGFRQIMNVEYVSKKVLNNSQEFETLYSKDRTWNMNIKRIKKMNFNPNVLQDIKQLAIYRQNYCLQEIKKTDVNLYKKLIQQRINKKQTTTNNKNKNQTTQTTKTQKFTR